VFGGRQLSSYGGDWVAELRWWGMVFSGCLVVGVVLVGYGEILSIASSVVAVVIVRKNFF
jgi:hypothetical protein